MTDEYEISIARACCLMEIHRSYFYYESVKDDTEVEEAIRSAAEYGDGRYTRGSTTTDIP